MGWRNAWLYSWPPTKSALTKRLTAWWVTVTKCTHCPGAMTSYPWPSVRIKSADLRYFVGFDRTVLHRVSQWTTMGEENPEYYTATVHPHSADPDPGGKRNADPQPWLRSCTGFELWTLWKRNVEYMNNQAFKGQGEIKIELCRIDSCMETHQIWIKVLHFPNIGHLIKLLFKIYFSYFYLTFDVPTLGTVPGKTFFVCVNHSWAQLT